ncbi:MAG: glycoside hydrolase family 44 protein [Bryobacteraceae bacterium]|nr:glycoside hydrolase family 44 protein [Bryobacteraceae bacterium]
MRGAASVLVLVAPLCFAQTLVVDRDRDRHPINPNIYGINFYWSARDTAAGTAARELRVTARRWGGNNTSRYHWSFDVSNLDADWFFEVLPDNRTDASKLPEGSSFNRMMDHVVETGGIMISTMPIMGWMPKARQRMCSFSVQKYGPQCRTDPYWSDCGDGRKPDCRTNIENDPYDTNVPVDEEFGAEWVRYLAAKYGPANRGGVAVWSLDNEPIWWSGTHRDIHPQPQEYDETFEKGMRWAKAIKSADPTALVTGPVSAGWESFYFSLKDCNAGWRSRGVNGGADWQYWNNPVDRREHDGKAFVPWYLEQFRKYEEENGQRLLDVLDLHAYIAPEGIPFSKRGDEEKESLRLTSTRVFWDPEYRAKWTPDLDDLASPDYGKPAAAALIPRMKRWVADHYPGTQTAITEYHWGASESITGALAQADLLGIFGREGLDIATLWDPPAPTDPLAFAFRLFRNYDGQGSAFGDVSLYAASPDPDTLSVFAAERTADKALTVLVINKTPAERSARLELAGLGAGSLLEQWRYSEADLARIERADDVRASDDGSIETTAPGYSLTLFVVPAPPPPNGEPAASHAPRRQNR